MKLKIPVGTAVAAVSVLIVLSLWAFSFFGSTLISFQFEVKNMVLTSHKLVGVSNFNGNIEFSYSLPKGIGRPWIHFKEVELVEPGTVDALNAFFDDSAHLIRRPFGKLEVHLDDTLVGKMWWIKLPHWLVALFIGSIGALHFFLLKQKKETTSID